MQWLFVQYWTLIQPQAELREARSQISEDKEEGERDEIREQEFALMQAQVRRNLFFEMLASIIMSYFRQNNF